MQGITALLVVCLAVAAYAVPSGRIVGGTDAPEGKYPYQVSLRQYGSLLCGGSILNKRYILTAAHCLTGRSLSAIKVHAGTVYLDQEGEVYGSEKFIVHEHYNAAAFTNDLGLIRVSKDIEFNGAVQPIKLASDNNAKGGDHVVLSGWGRLRAWGEVPNQLQQIDLLIEDQKTCAQRQPKVVDSHICTFTKAGEGACNGDSGGPLVANGVQVGIVSFGVPCAYGYPDVFTRVHSFLDWIEKNQEL